ncbi:MAG: GNAT family N-acetyltransferase [Gammaproteobacteria bacterium]|nr:GNAT family N-acetyltransferase [Gammaproteobacteria bacterium]
MPVIEVHSLRAERLADFLHFFDHIAFADNDEWRGCYCYFHYHEPANGEWRCRSAQENRQAMVALIGEGRAEGLLAYEDDEVVGWCNAAPRELFPVLRRLPGNSEGTAFVPCFLIAPGRRRQGIARRLLQAACDAFERRGYRRLLGKPVRGVTSPADNAFGPLAIFIEAGFSVLFEDEKGNVYVEKKLKPDAAPEKRPSQEAPEPP